jgi:hypothetical protein
MIELADVIRDLREELEIAVNAAPPKGLRFELGTVELEVALVVDDKVGGGAKVRFYVVDLGADASTGTSSTQRVTLTLQPRMVGSSQPPYVSGPAALNER